MLNNLVKIRYFYVITSFIIIANILLITPATSSEAQKNTNYLTRPEVIEFINKLHTETNIPKSKITAILKKAKKSEKALELISKPIENKACWFKYRKIFVNKTRIDQGVKFWEKNKDKLAQIEKEYGVPAAIIVSILGVETYYGKHSGDFSVLDVLTTLSFDFPRRKKFFQNELKHFLIFTYQQKIDPQKIKGSYAGAMGMPQFMPSNYTLYATCKTKSRNPDIWNRANDSIESVANYMKQHGWKKNKLIALRVVTHSSGCEKVISNRCKCTHTIKQLKQAGWHIQEKLVDSDKAMPMKHRGANGDEFWIGLHNFEVITKYNKSQMYALAVCQLAEALNQQRQAVSFANVAKSF